MRACWAPVDSKANEAFTLVEVVMAMFIFAMVISGAIYGYVQANRMAEWSSMSFAAQSYSSQGAEQARAADWRPRDWPQTNGPGTMDELPPTNYIMVDILDIPAKGHPGATNFLFWVTNYVSVANVSADPALRQIRSDCVWNFPVTGRRYTNTVILLRAPDQ
jgi:prepilin-type N-terminal cleavage/methylation domain-containing protein